MGRTMVLALAGAFCAAGCRSDLSQQLLERELRMQEDQIYALQDELHDKCARLDHVADENRSLRRQLGFTDGDRVTPSGRGAPASAPAALPAPVEPMLVPPAIDLPDGGSVPRKPGAAPSPGTIAPPKLDGVPPLPGAPPFSGRPPAPAAETMAAAPAIDAAPEPLPPAGDARPIAPAYPAWHDPPVVRQLSHEESIAGAGRITHVVVAAERTQCFDSDGDGVSDGLAVVIEPRDDDERLVAAAGDVSIVVLGLNGGSAESAAVARWDIPARDAIARFRRTSRNRGLHFVLRWPGPPPAGEHVRVHVALATPSAAPFEAECTVPVRTQAPAAF